MVNRWLRRAAQPRRAGDFSCFKRFLRIFATNAALTSQDVAAGYLTRYLRSRFGSRDSWGIRKLTAVSAGEIKTPDIRLARGFVRRPLCGLRSASGERKNCKRLLPGTRHGRSKNRLRIRGGA